MIFTKNLPPSDYPHNFVVMWDFGGRLWSDTLRWNEGVLEEYRYEFNTFSESFYHPRSKGKCTYVLSI